jgi:hypothetical protein
MVAAPIRHQAARFLLRLAIVQVATVAMLELTK